jgi:hypothetical protein
MRIIGTKNRKAYERSGESKVYCIRRFRCDQCDRIHHELPDFLVPYKRYESECIESVLSNPTKHDVPADHSTLYRWYTWFSSLLDYWIGCLISIKLRIKQEIHPLHLSSANAESALLKIGRMVGNAPSWLARIVRPIVNFNLWIHTRSAFLSEGH